MRFFPLNKKVASQINSRSDSERVFKGMTYEVCARKKKISNPQTKW
jgi:hypothetical protein